MPILVRDYTPVGLIIFVISIIIAIDYNHDYCVIVIVDVDVNIDVDIYVEICSKPRSSNSKQNSEKKCIRIKKKNLGIG